MKKILFFISVFLLFINSANAQTQNIKDTNFSVISIESTKSIDNLIGHFDNKIKIIFSDIDGTILPPDKENPRKMPPESVIDAVKQLHQAQIPLILVTGRPYGEVKEIAKKIGNANTYIIALQGSEIINPKGKVIAKDNIKTNDVLNILDEINCIIKTNKFDSKVFAFVKGKPFATENSKLPYNWEKVTVVKSFSTLDKKNVSEIAIVELNQEKLKAIQTNLKIKFPDYHITISADIYCDISSNTATKGNAIKKLAKILNLDLKNSAALGDAENDLSMLKQVNNSGGLSIVVDNATDSVKSNASFITSSVYKDGFAKAINKILMNNELVK